MRHAEADMKYLACAAPVTWLLKDSMMLMIAILLDALPARVRCSNDTTTDDLSTIK
jgi:hypothetical protein